MDLSCIILSGELELYVLGMLPEDDARKIAQLAAMFPEIQQELDEIAAALQGTEADAQPSAAVRDRIFDAFDTLPVPSAGAPATTVADGARETQIIPLQTYKRRYTRLAAAASVAVIICAAGIAWLLNERSNNKNDLLAVQQQKAALQQQNDSIANTAIAYQHLHTMMRDSNYNKVLMAGVNGQNMDAQIYWNKSNGEVYIADMHMPPPPPGKQYQLWVIADGKPVDLGMLPTQPGMMHKMTATKTAQAFAITLEKEGGNPTPTMEAMQVMGGV